MELSERHKELLRHMLGIKADGGTPYRNYFVAGEGHTDMPVLNELLVDDYVVVRDNQGGSGYLYRATDKGREAVGAGVADEHGLHPPRLRSAGKAWRTGAVQQHAMRTHMNDPMRLKGL